MPVVLGAKVQAGFDQPLELMKDCHRRMEYFLSLLLRVAEGDGSLDEQRRQALAAALRYFREAAPRHTQDEEESLFPRLKRYSTATIPTSLERLATLEADHVLANALHDQVNADIDGWLREGSLAESDRQFLLKRLGALVKLYREHIHLEETVIFPLASATLDATELAAVGREMQFRRNPSGAASPTILGSS